MAQRIEAIVKPNMLVWARESARLNIETAAKKAQVTPERMALWEGGEARPTINQLRKLANAYKRPIAVFYLPEPPSGFQAMRDFRRLSGDVAANESAELALEIRSVMARREVALELISALDEETPDFMPAAALTDDAESLASEIRAYLGVSADEQISWKPGYASFNAWRAALENAGILVFQSVGVGLDEMRGFSISDMPLPAIVVNNKDSANGRIFTLLHELAHILLRDGGICDLYDENEIEVFCNRVAGAALMPRERLVNEDIVASKADGMIWSDGELQALSNRYGVSNEVTLRRLLSIGRASASFYGLKREQFQKEYLTRNNQGGPVPQYRKAISRTGRSFAVLVLRAYRQNYITASDVSDFLEVKLKHLPKVESAVFQTS